MATKLKNLKITKVDFVDDGANPKADIKLFKSKDGIEPPKEGSVIDNPNFWKRLGNAIAKAFKADDGAEPEDNSGKSEVAKGGAESFSDKFSEVKNRKICDEIWDICYALQSSFCSILNDEELDSTSAENAMKESLDEFTGVVSSIIGQWSSGKAANIVKCETEVTAAELEMMKSVKARLEETIEKSVVVSDKGPEQTNITESKGETEMNIDKSKLTEAERAFLESIEKRYGTGETPTAPQTTPVVLATTPAAENQVEKSATKAAEPTPTVPEADDNIYKGLNPAVKAELEALKKFKEDAEDNAIREVAKRYAVIGKTEEELFPVLKNMKAAGGTAYDDTIAILNQAVATVEKSAVFAEIGKSGGNGGTAGGEAWAKAETQAAEIMKSKNVTKAQALDEVFQNNSELAAECEKEE